MLSANSAQQKLIAYYPLPNVAGNANYNYQSSILAGSNQDAMQFQANKSIGHKDQLYGSFAFQSNRSDNASLFRFHDRTDTLGFERKTRAGSTASTQVCSPPSTITSAACARW